MADGEGCLEEWERHREHPPGQRADIPTELIVLVAGQCVAAADQEQLLGRWIVGDGDAGVRDDREGDLPPVGADDKPRLDALIRKIAPARLIGGVQA